MKRAIVGFIIGVVVSGTAFATAFWSADTPFNARIRCKHMSEDSAAHVRLIAYDPIGDGTLRLVYRCRRSF